MTDQLSRALFPFIALLVMLFLFIFNSVNDHQFDSNNKPAVQVYPEYIEIVPSAEGPIPALERFFDSPNAINEMIQKLDLYDDTGFSHLSDVHPLLRRRD